MMTNATRKPHSGRDNLDIIIPFGMLIVCTVAIVINMMQPSVLALVLWVVLLAVNMALLARAVTHPRRKQKKGR